MIAEKFRRLIIIIGLLCFKMFPDRIFPPKLKRKIYLADLKRKDWARWNVERARAMGVKVGENCRLYSVNVFSEPYLLEIGDNVIVSGNVNFILHDGGIFRLKDEIPDIRGYFGRIKIGDNCFIGIGATILPNVKIGNNCVIGAGAVVNQSFPDDTVIMGNPAKAAFKTSMYVRMKKNSKHIVRCPEWPFPTRIPDADKRELLLEKNDIPDPPKARKKIRR